jgi:membrane-associated phospholipid phosphatase
MEKKLIITARALSLIFNPFYLPLVGLILLFWFSYLKLLPFIYKLTVLLLVYLFTILFPTLIIRFYRNYHGWKLFQLGQRERRMVPYIISIVSYFTCYYIMNFFRIPHFISTLLVIAIVLQLLCAFINVWWKISTHSAAIGAVTGTLIIFSEIFGFYLLWWLCLAIIISGLVGSSRMILRQHNLSQVLVGYALGLVISIFIIIYI